MSLFLSITLILVLCRILGPLATRLKQPALVGEILAGVVVGPACLGWLHSSPAFEALTSLAAFFIVLSAGLEIKWSKLSRILISRSPWVALLNLGIPLVSGCWLGIRFGVPLDQALVLALCISVTALPVAIRILESFGTLDTRSSHVTIGAALINDVTILMILGFLLNDQTILTSGSVKPGLILMSLGKVAAFIALILALNPVLKAIRPRWVQGHSLSFALIVSMVLGCVSELLGLQFVIGAFLGGILLGHHFESVTTEATPVIRSVTNSLLGPIFFAAIGLPLAKIPLQSIPFMTGVLVFSIVSKIVSGWMGGRLARLGHRESIEIGIVSNSRGVMGLLIAKLALDHHLISVELYSILVMMDLVTTLLTPILYRHWITGPISRDSPSLAVTERH
jgi:Kef-type K+ transport system membrane component KefB